MNIILLSGGSGKRLWPLSNDIRSKQFIKIFKNEEEQYESMLQRIYSQIISADENANILVATNKKQVSSIKNQLNDSVSICVEPSRRDTFPAIALASAYMKFKLKKSGNESVVICPVDPYVDNNYFSAIKSLFELSKTSSANLHLMGVEPTYPSEKYGYIIPEDAELISKIKSFKEKPSEKLAEEYIDAGALWNCGVFAFKIDYVLNILKKFIDFNTYEDILSQYAELPKISFDYAVSEKEKNAISMRFSGNWKDIGTWNTLTEEMEERAIGKAIFNEECENTHVINDLQIPILCMGCKDMVIAANNDGILVSSKKESSYIKPYVEKMKSQTMFAEKSWGNFKILDVSDKSLTIKITLSPGSKLHYHSHEQRKESWNIISGRGEVIIDEKKQFVNPGDVVFLPTNSKHTIIAITELNIIEVQSGNVSVTDKKKYPMPEQVI